MKHTDLDQGTLRAYLDSQLEPGQLAAVEDHLKDCAACQQEVQALNTHASCAREGLGRLPELPEGGNVAIAWAEFQRKREDAMDAEQSHWGMWQKLSLAGGGLAAVALLVALTVAPVRAWAENLLAIFRVEHFTVLELNPDSFKNNGLQNNQMLNQTVGRMLSDEVTVTQKPQKPQLVANAAAASKLTGFPVQLLSGETPAALVFESGVAVQMKLDQDRLQSILEEAGRSDLQIPASVDGALIAVRVPPGVMAFYGHCGNTPSQLVASAPDSDHQVHVVVGAGGRPIRSHEEADSSCITLMELPSPTVSAPAEINPAQIAQVVLQFLGMSENDAANFTQTVDWTSTLVLPTIRGRSSFEQVHVHGNDGALLRPTGHGQTDRFSLIWVDDGILHALNGTGDDTTAINLASQLE
jgi:putative zinc finger protein